LGRCLRLGPGALGANRSRRSPILGVALGSDRFAREYSITGEELDDRKRAAALDEALGILQAAW
jgi:hypothetical protein